MALFPALQLPFWVRALMWLLEVAPFTPPGVRAILALLKGVLKLLPESVRHEARVELDAAADEAMARKTREPFKRWRDRYCSGIGCAPDLKS